MFDAVPENSLVAAVCDFFPFSVSLKDMIYTVLFGLKDAPDFRAHPGLDNRKFFRWSQEVEGILEYRTPMNFSLKHMENV